MERFASDTQPAGAFPDSPILDADAETWTTHQQPTRVVAAVTRDRVTARQATGERGRQFAMLSHAAMSVAVVLAVPMVAIGLYLAVSTIGSPSSRALIAVNTTTTIGLLFSAVLVLLLRRGDDQRWLRVGIALLVIPLGILRAATHAAEPASSVADLVWGCGVSLFASVLFLLACLGGRSTDDRSELARSIRHGAVGAFALLGLFQVWGLLVDRWGVRAGSVLTALHPGSTWRDLAESITIATASAALLAASPRQRADRVPRWLLISLIVWAVIQLPLLAPASVRLAWPVSGLALLFAATVSFGVLIDIRQRAALTPVPAWAAGTLPPEARRQETMRFFAHEIGSPLAAVRTWVDFLVTDPSLSSRQERILKGMQREVASMDALLADMRSISLMQDDVFEVVLQPTPIGQIMFEAVQYAESLPGHHRVIIDITSRQLVLADPIRIGQVLRNLLNNADKYSSPETPIVLRAMPHRERVRIEVIDHGIGINAEDQPGIFKKFGRGRDVAGHEIPGMGIGLYVAQQIVQAHDSVLRVRSTPGRGSQFAFDLRIA